MLLTTSHTRPPDALPRLVSEAFAYLGAEATALYMVDYDQVRLVRVHEAPYPERLIKIEGTLAGRAFVDGRTQVGNASETCELWVPLVDGSDRLGVVSLVFAAPPDDATVAEVELVAALVAELVVTRKEYGDTIEKARRTLPLTLASEIQWRLLPPLTLITDRVVISGMLVPAHAVAGDSFDYALDGTITRLAIFDAMGHGLSAALMATVAVSTFRNARRMGLDLDDAARAIDKVVTAEFGPDRFVTGVLAELDVATGVYRWVNAGHPPVLILRDGQVIKVLDSRVNPPFGLLADDVPLADEERLQASDRLLLYTDGVTDARTPDGQIFGVERLVDLVTRQAASRRPAAETMRRLTLALLDHHHEVLDDDATTLLVEWLGRP
jgi:serine phosphatase RsbU (regulator of sigma subunit)